MKITYSLGKNFVEVPEQNICPICGCAIKPVFLEGAVYKVRDNASNIALILQCTACHQAFFYHSNAFYDDGKYKALHDSFVVPKNTHPVNFNDSIKNISPNFIEIYNQAHTAETSLLNHIAGMGYRKALEFLVKDFIIYKDPSLEVSVKAAQLGTCIEKYIDDNKIKALAKASAWIGNDETHYVRKHEDRDIEDLKKFINTLVAYIDYELVSDEALAFVSK